MNEIFVGAKVIFQNEIWVVERLPTYLPRGGWMVEIRQGHTITVISICNVIMPEGLNEKRRYE